MGIKDALASVPSRPALFIAPLLVVLVLSLYYRDQYNKCVEIRQTRAALTDQLQALGSVARFRLVDFTDFAWTRVRIVPGVTADTISDTCPLDWNWQRGERDALIASGRLAAMMFGQQGQIVKYFEFRADEVEFLGVEGSLTPQTAVFGVAARPGNAGGFRLTLAK